MSDQRNAQNEANTMLTNRQGLPITNNQSFRTVSNRGPTTLENYDFLEKVTLASCF